MIQLNNFNNLQLISGTSSVQSMPDVPFSDISISFLDNLSNVLRKSKEAIIYPDLMAYSFWCRKGNIKKLKSKYKDLNQRLGRGIAFHIAPSNVPLGFGYSFTFGLLAGNSNIIKIPSKNFFQAEYLGKVLMRTLKLKKYKTLYNNTAFIKYDRQNTITEYLSSICDTRVIWGGDSTIKNIREFQMPVRSIDIVFSDRYSICIIDVAKLDALTDKKLSSIIELFYNDTFLMDQNACSSPHIIFWYGKKNKAVKNKFWKSLQEYVENKYSIDNNIANDKYIRLCRAAIEIKAKFDFKNYNNYIYRISLNELPANIDEYRGNSGYFFEYDIKNLDEICPAVNKKYQTLTYFGMEKSLLVDFVRKNKLSGIDRVVPIGRALDVGLIWDGYEIISTLSRRISFN